MRSALLALCLAGAALAAPPAGEEARREEDRALREQAAKAEYEEALKRWQEQRGAGGDDRAMRERLDRILREETTRDAIRAKPPEKEEVRPEREPERREEPQRSSSPPPSAGIGSASSSSLASLMYFFLILVAAIVLAFATYAIVMAVMHARRRPPVEGNGETPEDAEERGGAAPPVVRDPEAWLADARRHAAAGRWLDALRCLLFASLERLHRARFIDYTRARTNRECVRAFTGPEERRAPFRSLVDEFDLAVYGQQPVGAEDYARAEAAARELGKGGADESVS